MLDTETLVYEFGTKAKLTLCKYLCIWQVVNGAVQTPGDQDAEDTQLMAIYAKDSQTEDKVRLFCDAVGVEMTHFTFKSRGCSYQSCLSTPC